MRRAWCMVHACMDTSKRVSQSYRYVDVCTVLHILLQRTYVGVKRALCMCSIQHPATPPTQRSAI